MSNLGLRTGHWITLGAFLVGILLFQLGTRGLNEPDEGRYANIALESLEMDHPWWEPQLADVGHYDKPPLTYWVSALGYRVFGVNEWGARLPSLLGALFTLAGVGWMAFRRYGPQTAWLAVLVAGTLFQIWLWGRILSCDMLLTGWCSLAIAAWAETRHREGRVGPWLLQVLFWSLAGWTKATPALIPMLGLAIYVYAAGDARDRQALRLPLLLPLVILASIPWYIVIIGAHPALYHYFLHRELVQRISGHIDGRGGPIYYYLPLCLLGWLPWWPLAFAALVRQWRKLRAEHWRHLVSPGLCIVLTGFCIFSLVGSKHATYLLPFAPWAALEFARLLGRDPLLRRAAVVLPAAMLASAVYLTAVSEVPARESRMGMHSSLREVADVLHREHAVDIYSDHFWPSLEVYYGERIHFTEPAPEETFEKCDMPSEHFGFGNAAPKPGQWFVHFRKSEDPTFQRWLNDPRVPKITVGDFVAGPLDSPAVAVSVSGNVKPLLAEGKIRGSPLLR